MCIVCDNDSLGEDYLNEMQAAINKLKRCEKILLELSDIKNIKFEPTIEKANNYNKAHKKLVKSRKSLGDVEKLRSGGL